MAHSTSDTAFLTMEKSFTYRGVREHWANVYHLDQVPTDPSVWYTLANNVWSLERVFLPSNVQIEKYYGHTPGTPPVLVYELDVPPTGEGGDAGAFTPIATEHQAPGDSAVWLRWGTTQKNSLGKPIYLRNYYHAVFYDSVADTFSPRQKAALDAFGTQFTNGIGGGSQTFRRAGPRGAVAQNHASSQFITTRTLKARGKRHRITQAQVKQYIQDQKVTDFPFILGPAIG